MLRKGEKSENGQVEILDEDRLCYIVKNVNRGAVGVRIISKELLSEFINYISTHPNCRPDEVRNELSGQTDIDKYEYGYASTLVVMAKMILQKGPAKEYHLNKISDTNSLQQIYFGAPGTGKSHEIKKQVKKK